MPKTLAEWLSYIEQLHPESIEMGLGRVNQLVKKMALSPNCTIITVAGTNGKGSTSAMLEHIYAQAGYQVGCYSSPHFLYYNERLRINKQSVSDADFCQAFQAVEAARTSINVDLTYFEFGTLAAVWLMGQASLDVAILEVGLGGRLDAVNAFDADCAIVTNIALDHQDFLGDTRDDIAKEKAGVYRANTPAICGDENPPTTLKVVAETVNADFKQIGEHFEIEHSSTGYRYMFKSDIDSQNTQLSFSTIGLSGEYQTNNAACALTAVYCLQSKLAVTEEAMQLGLASVSLPGRFEVIEKQVHKGLPKMLFDVAHNPHAAHALADTLQVFNQNNPTSNANTVAVFGMLANKDWVGVIQAVHTLIDYWFVGAADHPRSADPESLKQAILSVQADAKILTFEDVKAATTAVLKNDAGCELNPETDKMLVFGSFYTVSDVKAFLQVRTRV